MKKMWIVSAVLLLIPALVYAEQELEKCTLCHDVAERYANVPKMGHMSCTGCHFGDGTTDQMELAHDGMYADPTDFSIIDSTCGTCHPKIVASAKKM